MSVLSEHREDLANFWASEIQKCKESRAYFFNNYITLPNGAKPFTVTDKELDMIEQEAFHNRFRRGRR